MAGADAATDAAMDAALRRLQGEHAAATAAAEDRHRIAMDQVRTLAASELDVERQRCDDLRQQRAQHKAATEATVASLEARLHAAETQATQAAAEAAVPIVPPPPPQVANLMDDADTALGADTATASAAAADAEVRRLAAQLQASMEEAAMLASARDRAVSECHSVREEMGLLRSDVDATLAATNRACEQLRTSAAASESRALEAERLLECTPSDSLQVGCVTNETVFGRLRPSFRSLKLRARGLRYSSQSAGFRCSIDVPPPTELR